MGASRTRAGTVAWEESGAGRPMVLLHATLHDRRDYDPVAPALARSHRVIALDWPGHGDSPLPADGSAPSAMLFADALADVADDLDLRDAILVGNSVGGYAATRLALERPERVAGLVLVNSGGFVPMTPLERAYCRTLGRPAVARRVLPLTIGGYMKAQSEHDGAIRARVVGRARTPEGARVAASLWRSFADPEFDLRERARALRIPTLIVWGERDATLRPRVGRSAADAIPGAELAMLAAGHVVFSSMPERFVELVEDFLGRSLPAARAGASPDETRRST